MSTTIKTSEAFPGGCYLKSTLVHCAWKAEDCGAFTYVAYDQMPRFSICHDNHRLYAGMCTMETLCTSHPSNCIDPDTFVQESPFCNIEYNRYSGSLSGPFHLSGSCEVDGKSVCVYSENDCPGTFSRPYDMQYSSDCTCDNTLTGACQDGMKFHCAVSADACAEGQEFVTWQELEGQAECKLCNSFKKETRRWPVPADYDTLPVKTEEAGAVGLVIGLLVGVILVGAGFFLFSQRCHGRRSSATDLTPLA